MDDSNKWKVVRRMRTASADPLALLQNVHTHFSGEPLLIAGPFDSMTGAQHWIDIHPEQGQGLAVAPIVLPPLPKGSRHV